jgi:Plasmid pRiA4b ORF-3-like protein
MQRRSKQALQEEDPALVASDGDPLVQIKVWLLGISPMVWRRVRVPADCTLRELHGVFQVATGWEGIHLYHSVCAPLGTAPGNCRRLRRMCPWRRFSSAKERGLSYDLNTPWRHEVCIEARPPSTPGKTYAARRSR